MLPYMPFLSLNEDNEACNVNTLWYKKAELLKTKSFEILNMSMTTSFGLDHYGFTPLWLADGPRS